MFFPFSVFGVKTQKLVENLGPVLIRIATGAPPVSQMPVGFTRILTCEENLQKLVKIAKLQNPQEGEARDAVIRSEMRSVGGMRSAR